MSKSKKLHDSKVTLVFLFKISFGNADLHFMKCY